MAECKHENVKVIGRESHSIGPGPEQRGPGMEIAKCQDCGAGLRRPIGGMDWRKID